MSRTVFYDVPRGVLATLLDQVGQPEALSPRPLMGDAATLAKHHLAELHAGGFLELPVDGTFRPTPEFSRAARVILAPHTTVNLRAWRDEAACAETSLLFPQNILEEDGVVLNQIDGSYRISAPAGRDELVNLLGGLLPPGTDEPGVFEFEAHLDGPVAATFCGLLDLLRRQGGGSATGVDAGQLGAYLAGRWGLTGFDSLVSYVTVIGSMPKPPALNMVEFSLGALTGAGIVADSAGVCTLAPAFKPMLELIPAVMPGLQWQRVSDTDGDALLTSHRIFIFGKNGWILRFAPSSRGRIFISSMTAGQALDELVDELATMVPRRAGKPAPPAPGTEAQGARRCPACGQPQDGSRKFCTACGAPIPAGAALQDEAHRCKVCNAPMAPGKRFCTQCGAAR